MFCQAVPRFALVDAGVRGDQGDPDLARRLSEVGHALVEKWDDPNDSAIGNCKRALFKRFPGG